LPELDPNRWKSLAIVCAAFFMTVLDVSIVNVALPSIGKSLHISEQGLQWVITAYAITFGGFLLLGGRAADLLGRRRVFYVGVTVFTIASFLCGLLVGGRADRRTRPAGLRRRDHLPRGALDHHDDVRRRPGTEQSARDLGRDRRLGRCRWACLPAVC
jgi:Permeases of the major facilitator superfamily